MNKSISLSSAMKTAAAAVVLCGAAGLAFAQGTPPNTASPNPATGAGQQSPAGGPMGTTGVMPQNQGGATGGAGMSSGGSSSRMSGSSMSNNNDMSMSSDRSSRHSRRMHHRRARADRN